MFDNKDSPLTLFNNRFQQFSMSFLSIFALSCVLFSLYGTSNHVGKRKRSMETFDNFPAKRKEKIGDHSASHSLKEFFPIEVSRNDLAIKAKAESIPQLEGDAKRSPKEIKSRSYFINTTLSKKGYRDGIKTKDEDISQKKQNKESLKPAVKFEYPVFPEDYHATGLLILPHSGIAEPFEIWYAPTHHKSRIDYYYGTDKTFQLGSDGEFGTAYKYVPMYNDKKGSFDGCWSVRGTKHQPVIPQIISPNITWFKYNKTEVYTGTLTTKWTYQYYAYGMSNSQSVWVTKSKPNRPIRYEMFGFDTMLGSYYDHYVIEYISFDKLSFEEEIFQLPEGINCSHWGASLESSFAVNPMQEFAAFSLDKAVNLTALYEEYKAQIGQPDAKGKDNDLRRHIFKHNVRMIKSHNRKQSSFKLEANPFLDLTKTELELHHGSLVKDNKKHKGIKSLDVEDSLPNDMDIPDELDWRDYGAVSHVKGQGICGACYAFTAAGAAEGAWYRKTGHMVEVSSQQLVDCSWGFGNHGCKGGHYATSLSWIYTHGISTSRSYGKYLGQEGYCHFNDTWFGANIDGFSYIQPWNKTALKIAVAKYGPIAVSINTRPLTFKFYSHGIYDDSSCAPNRTTHSALVVGYGKEGEKEFWIVKNSWSTTWGENGYIRVSMENDICGITEYPVAVVVYNPQFQLPHKSKAFQNDKGMKIHPKSRSSAITKNVQNKLHSVSAVSSNGADFESNMRTESVGERNVGQVVADMYPIYGKGGNERKNYIKMTPLNPIAIDPSDKKHNFKKSSKWNPSNNSIDYSDGNSKTTDNSIDYSDINSETTKAAMPADPSPFIDSSSSLYNITNHILPDIFSRDGDFKNDSSEGNGDSLNLPFIGLHIEDAEKTEEYNHLIEDQEQLVNNYSLKAHVVGNSAAGKELSSMNISLTLLPDDDSISDSNITHPHILHEVTNDSRKNDVGNEYESLVKVSSDNPKWESIDNKNESIDLKNDKNYEEREQNEIAAEVNKNKSENEIKMVLDEERKKALEEERNSELEEERGKTENVTKLRMEERKNALEIERKDEEPELEEEGGKTENVTKLRMEERKNALEKERKDEEPELEEEGGNTENVTKLRMEERKNALEKERKDEEPELEEEGGNTENVTKLRMEERKNALKKERKAEEPELEEERGNTENVTKLRMEERKNALEKERKAEEDERKKMVKDFNLNDGNESIEHDNKAEMLEKQKAFEAARHAEMDEVKKIGIEAARKAKMEEQKKKALDAARNAKKERERAIEVARKAKMEEEKKKAFEAARNAKKERERAIEVARKAKMKEEKKKAFEDAMIANREEKERALEEAREKERALEEARENQRALEVAREKQRAFEVARQKEIEEVKMIALEAARRKKLEDKRKTFEATRVGMIGEGPTKSPEVGKAKFEKGKNDLYKADRKTEMGGRNENMREASMKEMKRREEKREGNISEMKAALKKMKQKESMLNKEIALIADKNDRKKKKQYKLRGDASLLKDTGKLMLEDKKHSLLSQEKAIHNLIKQLEKPDETPVSNSERIEVIKNIRPSTNSKSDEDFLKLMKMHKLYVINKPSIPLKSKRYSKEKLRRH